MLNKVVLMGRLTADPELRQGQTGVAIATFSLAVERPFRGQGEENRQTDFFSIVCFRHTAEFTSKWFHKGQLVAVSGRLQTRKWTDKEGHNRTSIEVVADETYFAERRSNDSGPGYNQSEHTSPGESSYETPEPSNPVSTFAEIETEDDDLPF